MGRNENTNAQENENSPQTFLSPRCRLQLRERQREVFLARLRRVEQTGQRNTFFIFFIYSLRRMGEN